MCLSEGETGCESENERKQEWATVKSDTETSAGKHVHVYGWFSINMSLVNRARGGGIVCVRVFSLFLWYINQEDKRRSGWVKDGLSSAHRLFSRLLLNSLIMSERKSRRTSISSVLGAELFNNVATTLRITDMTRTQTQTYTHIFSFTREPSASEGTKFNVTHNRLTWVLNLDSGVGLRVRFVNYLCAHLLCQNLTREAVRKEWSVTHSVHRPKVQQCWDISEENVLLPRTECCRSSRSQCWCAAWASLPAE